MKKGIIALLCAGAFALSGCYGHYGCWHKFHKWNGTLGSKWMNSVVHFVLNVIPVYGILYFVDFLVINTIEFWTGSNPIASGDSYFEKDAQGNSVAAVKNADGSMTATFTTAKGESATFTFQRDENVIRALDANGEVVAHYEVEK